MDDPTDSPRQPQPTQAVKPKKPVPRQESPRFLGTTRDYFAVQMEQDRIWHRDR